MKARFSYPLLCLPVCAVFAGLVAIVFVACAAGIMWIFIYGDNEWPAASDHVVMGLAVLVFAATLAALLGALHKFGKGRESRGGLAGKHVAVAIVATLVLPLLVLLRQWSMGAIGSRNAYVEPTPSACGADPDSADLSGFERELVRKALSAPGPNCIKGRCDFRIEHLADGNYAVKVRSRYFMPGQDKCVTDYMSEHAEIYDPAGRNVDSWPYCYLMEHEMQMATPSFEIDPVAYRHCRGEE